MIDQAASLRAWLACVLRDQAIVDWPAQGDSAAQVLAVAESEGVTSLVHQRLHVGKNAGNCPPELLLMFARAARTAATRSLAQVKECRRISTLLADAGIASIFLKGSALCRWLYDSPYLRECGDIDMLFASRNEVERAIEMLLGAGYCVRERTIPGDLITFELSCESTSEGSTNFEFDLHWKLCNSALFCDVLQWDELRAEAIALSGIGPQAMGLAPVHALLHACLHRVIDLQKGTANRLRYLYDIRLLSQRMDAVQWQQCVALAASRGVAGVCADGLLSAQRDLDGLAPPDVLTALDSAARREPLKLDRLERWHYAQWATMRALPTWKLQMRWAWQRLWPDPDHVREHYGRLEGHGLAVYLWRHFKRGMAKLWPTR